MGWFKEQKVCLPTILKCTEFRRCSTSEGRIIFSAEASYETAILLAPTQTPLRLWFAGFLSRDLGDLDRGRHPLCKMLRPWLKMRLQRVTAFLNLSAEESNEEEFGDRGQGVRKLKHPSRSKELNERSR
jgi:hypothetical protein